MSAATGPAVTVTFAASLRSILPDASPLVVRAEGNTVRAVLTGVERRRTGTSAVLLDAEGRLRPYLMIVHGGTSVVDLDAPAIAGDGELLVLSAFAGG
jgi:hypothetical protein